MPPACPWAFWTLRGMFAGGGAYLGGRMPLGVQGAEAPGTRLNGALQYAHGL